MNELVDAINNLIINSTVYELNKAPLSDSQGNLTSDPDTVTHTSNGPDTVNHTSKGILDKQLLSCRNIGKVSASPPPEKPILLAPQTLMTPAVRKILADATSGNAWTDRTP